MPEKKQKSASETISFRVPSLVAERIREGAKEMNMPVRDYFFSQISPTSQLGKILNEQQQKVITKSKGIAELRKKMANEAKAMRESLNLSEDEFNDVLQQATRMILKGE